MRGLFTNNSVNIQAGQAVSGIADHAHTLRINAGRVWLTVEGIRQDYWLHAGDSFTVIPGRLIVVEADRVASRIELAPRQPALQLRKAATQLGDMVRRLMPGNSGKTVLHRRTVAAPAQCGC